MIVEKSVVAANVTASKSGDIRLQMSILNDEIYKELTPKTALQKVFDF